jgi:tripartite ATP-independent transporter DctP family solute receptor
MLRTLRIFWVAAAVLHASLGVALAQPQFNLRFASFAPDGDIFDRAAHRFAEDAARLTNGQVKVTIFRSNSLGSNREALEMAKVGSVDFVIAGSTHVSRYAPVLISVSFPYMWKDADTMFRLVDGDVGKRVREVVARQGLEILGWWETGFRHVSNSRRPIVKPEDIRGLKLRTLPSPVHVAFFRKLGAIPTPMDWAEVMPALQQGVIDGQENPPSVMYPYRVFEFQKFYSLTGHSNDPTLLVMSGPVLARMPKNVQDAIMKAARDATVFQRQLADEYNRSIMGKLGEVIKINQVPEETLAHFRKTAQSVYQEAYGDLGDDGRAIVDAIVKATN